MFTKYPYYGHRRIASDEPTPIGDYVPSPVPQRRRGHSGRPIPISVPETGSHGGSQRWEARRLEDDTREAKSELVRERVTDERVVDLEQARAKSARSAEPSTDTSREQIRQVLQELQRSKERLERDNERQLDEQRAKLVEKLLPVFDNLERTVQAASQHPGRDSNLLEGVKIVRDQFAGLLDDLGVEKVSADNGQAFDPRVHEAVGIVGVDQDRLDGAVVDVVLPGYRMQGKLLRPAKVRVGKSNS